MVIADEASKLSWPSSLSEVSACMLQKEMNPADDPRLVERVDLKTGQKKFVYRDEEAE